MKNILNDGSIFPQFKKQPIAHIQKFDAGTFAMPNIFTILKDNITVPVFHHYQICYIIDISSV